MSTCTFTWQIFIEQSDRSACNNIKPMTVKLHHDMWARIYNFADFPPHRALVRLAAFYSTSLRLKPSFSDVALKTIFNVCDRDFLVATRDIEITYPGWPKLQLYSGIHPEPYRRPTRLRANGRVFEGAENICAQFTDIKYFKQFTIDLAHYCQGGVLDVEVCHINESLANEFETHGFEIAEWDWNPGQINAFLFIEAPVTKAVQHRKRTPWQPVWGNRGRAPVGFFSYDIIVSNTFLRSLKANPNVSAFRKHKNWTVYYIGKKFKKSQYFQHSNHYRLHGNDKYFVIEHRSGSHKEEPICSIPFVETVSQGMMIVWVHVNNRKACTGFKLEVFDRLAKKTYAKKASKLTEIPDELVYFDIVELVKPNLKS